MKIFFYAIVLTFVGSSFSTSAQTANCNCCSSNYNDFDFWLGDWEVRNQDGEVVGSSKIQKLERNCLISEEWSGNNNVSGRSYNYFDPNKKTWNQLWISSTGNILRLEGQLENNQMVLTSPVQLGQKGAYKDEIVWSPREDGTVTQEWVQLFEEDNRRDIIFFGVYHKRE